ncbi:phosphopantetheine-binding protein [Streptomyces sp. 1222.5]|uniref:phosphopantetheine-binding protein n=1 Tax=Streptomyces sp. 1222.5 TaxID=1881026 RepID=UPI003EBF2AB0
MTNDLPDDPTCAQDDTKRAMKEIISAILEVSELPISSNFYDLGGTSLQAMRICARINKELGIQVSPDGLFESDTLEGFCAEAAEVQRDA